MLEFQSNLHLVLYFRQINQHVNFYWQGLPSDVSRPFHVCRFQRGFHVHAETASKN